MASACTCMLPIGVPGGQCQWCRINQQMDLVNQLKLEFGMRPHAFFITVTYDDAHLPIIDGKANLIKEHLDNYIKRIRRFYQPKTIKVFAVGEYGGYLFGNEKAKRAIHPHYHIAVFADFPEIASTIRGCVEKKWTFGHAHVLILSAGLINYITGYVTKKLTNDKSMATVMGLDITPEFRYGRGLGDVSNTVIAVQEQHGLVEKIRVDGKIVNVPKYIREKVKRKFLEFGLDMTDYQKLKGYKNHLRPQDHLTYEERRKNAKAERLMLRMQRLEEKDAEIIAASGSDEIYEARALVKKASILEFKSKMELKKSTKRKKVL